MKFLSNLLCIILFSGCVNNYNPIPKPRAYHKIHYPAKQYKSSGLDHCPFSFEIPNYSQLVQKENYFGEEANPCWVNIEFQDFNAKLHLSYKSIDDTTSIDKILADTRELTWKHTVKAQYIDETPIHKSENVNGVLYSVGGNAASALQFYLTDSSSHFLRASLYFNNRPNRDSIEPVLQYLQADVMQFIHSFEWK